MDWRQSSAKALKRSRKLGVLRVFVVEDFGDALGEVGDLLGELEDGLFPVDLVGLAVLEEELEDFYEVFGVVEGAVEGDAVVLVEDGARRGTGRGCW